MKIETLQLIETAALIVLYVFLLFATRTVVNKSLRKALTQPGRRKIIVTSINLLNTLIIGIIIASIWGLEQHEIAVFASTVITALGIAFFAQWSLLSNITSSIILFFNHPLKIGDRIKILDKEFPFEGEVTEMAFFFMHIQTTEGELVTIPNSIVLQKSISIIHTSDSL